MITKANPILPSKLYIPPFRKGFVSRARLLKMLNAGLERKLTLVSAPAGYGKSTILSEWVGQAGKPVAWLSLDKADNDPSRFWSYFVAALQEIPGLEDVWVGEDIFDPRQTHSIPDNETFLANLIVVFTSISERFVLILDDLQAVTDAGILDGLFFLLENLPPGPTGLHLVIASRNDPPWPLARLRVSNEFTEIRARELCFTVDETAAFLKDVMGLALSPDEIAELDQRTEGWIAGLQMAAISMQGRDDLSGFLDAFTGGHRFVLDFLLEEVLNRQPAGILEFLLKTSILAQLTGPLCNALIDDCDGYEMLLTLEKANLFLVALDDQRTWYRYHHLFADLLQKQLSARYPERVPGLHHSASQWFAQNGLPIQAVSHALKTKDWEYAATRIEESIMDFIQHGEMTLARQWMRSLPEEVIHPRPILCIAQAWTSAKYTTVVFAEDLLAQAEAALTSDPDEGGSFDPQLSVLVSKQIAILQVVIARVRGDSIQRQQELALEALDRIIPSDDMASRATLLFQLGLCYIDLCKDEQADRTFSQALKLGQSSGNHYAAHIANYGRMVIAKRHGQLHALAALCRQTLDANITEDDPQQTLLGFALTMSGSLYYEWDDLDKAEHLLAQGLNYIEQMGVVELLIKGHFVFACLKAAKGNEAYPPDLEKMTENSHPGLTRFAAALQVRLYLLLARPDENAQFEAEINGWAESQELILRGEPTYDWEIFEKLTYARVLCRQYDTQPNTELKNKLQAALSFIGGQRQTLEDLKWQAVLVEVTLVMALILHHLERKAEALDRVEQALALAESQGYLRTFVDEGQPMRELLQRILVEGIHKAYARQLLTSFCRDTADSRLHTTWQPAPFIEPLSEREMQVLRLLKTQLSVPEISEEIHLAPTTVRTHVQHIYQKLGVHRRIEALQRAEKLGLL